MENETFTGEPLYDTETDLFSAAGIAKEAVMPVATLQEDGTLLFPDGHTVSEWQPVQKISDSGAVFGETDADPEQADNGNAEVLQEIYDYTDLLNEISQKLSSIRTLEASILQNQKTISDNENLYQKLAIGGIMLIFGGILAYMFLGRIK